ncbi:hypothetical protein ISCGN_001931 [Ixodes scapularis]
MGVPTLGPCRQYDETMSGARTLVPPLASGSYGHSIGVVELLAFEAPTPTERQTSRKTARCRDRSEAWQPAKHRAPPLPDARKRPSEAMWLSSGRGVWR